MKIAVIGAKGVPVKQGGIERYCTELYPRMVAQGHSVDLFARSSYTKSTGFSSSDYKGVRVISLPSIRLRGIDAFANAALAAIISSGKRYDIIHFHALGPAVFSWLSRIASSAKIVVTCQGLDWQRAKWGAWSSGLIRLGERNAVYSAHELVVVSQALQNYFLNTYSKNTINIPNAPGSYPESDPKFPYGKFLGLNSGRYILFLGRLVPEKRPDLLIKAFQRLKSNGWKLVIAGGDSDTHNYIANLHDLAGTNQDVLFVGELYGSRLAEIVRGAGLFVLPSDLEGLPLVMLEAMQEGIPVLASDIPPHQQLIGEERGLLFRAGDVDSCVQGLERAIRQPQELAEMAKKAQDHVATYYNWDKITADNLRLYQKLCASSDAKFSVTLPFVKNQ
ncbi:MULTISPECIES: glycosyltransferase family 4 protein [unclassified Moorena]|uniref:glycosyltransferase family 4 protein n=1 Tax=unclassified Moorena TaxID=2683338 RepID=UPI001400743F|nr:MULTISPECIES: glycosyltransferase family 4 protein [unclassified Moorena]NEO11132.1 glycosyltransferase family 4 protein [Moorena sp. SIO3E8]NEP98040.1 glycosyltransferase family 4 protein [Moorena sp. SIO3F7]